MLLKIITDSASDIPLSLQAQYDNLEVVPIYLSFPGEPHITGMNTLDMFKSIEEKDVLPKTAQVTPATFKEVFEKSLKDCDCIICVTISANGSGTFQSAMLAKSMVEGDIEVFDSQTYSFIYGNPVVKAAQMAKEGKTKQEILEMLNYFKARANALVVVDKLDYLKRGGRIGAVSAAVGGMLDIKPILTVKDGKIAPLAKVKGAKKVIPKIIEIMRNDGEDIKNQEVYIISTMDTESADAAKKAIEEEFSPKSVKIIPIGCIVAAHTGPRTYAVIYNQCVKQLDSN